MGLWRFLGVGDIVPTATPQLHLDASYSFRTPSVRLTSPTYGLHRSREGPLSMKAGWRLFAGLAAFYAVMAVIYYAVGGEAVGITAIALSGGLAGLVAFYLWFTEKRLANVLPEDNKLGEIADAAGELGFYSPHSWWPLPVALSACAMGLGLLIGWWLTLIALGSLIISILGFVLEYEKPSASAH